MKLINTIFTLSYCTKCFMQQPFTFCLVWRLKLDIANFVHVIWRSDTWLPCILPRWSCYKALPSYTNLLSSSQIGENGSHTRWLSFETIVEPSFRYMMFCMCYFCIQHSHYFLSYSLAQRVERGIWKVYFSYRYMYGFKLQTSSHSSILL